MGFQPSLQTKVGCVSLTVESRLDWGLGCSDGMWQKVMLYDDQGRVADDSAVSGLVPGWWDPLSCLWEDNIPRGHCTTRGSQAPPKMLWSSEPALCASQMARRSTAVGVCSQRILLTTCLSLPSQGLRHHEPRGNSPPLWPVLIPDPHMLYAHSIAGFNTSSEYF